MTQDVLPRFLVSDYYREMNARLRALEATDAALPGAENLSVSPPKASPLLKMDMDRTSLDDLKLLPWRGDRVLYEVRRRQRRASSPFVRTPTSPLPTSHIAHPLWPRRGPARPSRPS